MDEDDFDLVWKAWAEKLVARYNALYPDNPPFRLDEFDGCTFGLDVARHACLMHDLRYHHKSDRSEADRRLREDIIAIGRQEDRFGWTWTVIGWTYWLAVRVFGGRHHD